jgi:hypothetical protein
MSRAGLEPKRGQVQQAHLAATDETGSEVGRTGLRPKWGRVQCCGDETLHVWSGMKLHPFLSLVEEVVFARASSYAKMDLTSSYQISYGTS